MKASRKYLIALVAAALISGCSKPANQPAGSSADVRTRDTITASLGRTAEDVPAYPGMQITDTFPSENGVQFLGQSQDPIEQIAGFYVKEMQMRGWARDTGWYSRKDFLVFTKDRRQTRITLKPGGESGAVTMFSINEDVMQD